MEKAPPGVGMSFLVIDTEGKDSLKEIAIIDSKGRLVYHGFNQAEHPRHPECRPLSEIIAASQNIMADHRLVFHYAEHDLGVLSQAFQLTGRKLPRNPTACTWELPKELYPALGSYSQHRGRAA